MKKISLLIILLIGALVLASCSFNEGIDYTQPHLDFDFIKSTGISIDEVCNNLKISKEQLSKDSIDIGKYDFDVPVIFESYEFSKYLLFGEYNGKFDVLYGGGYEHRTNDKGETLTELVTSLTSMLTKSYGEPTTYPGAQNSIGNIKDFSEYSMASLKEQWSLSGENQGTITLKIQFYQENVTVRVEYIASATHSE